jgi:hypothetical protein
MKTTLPASTPASVKRRKAMGWGIIRLALGLMLLVLAGCTTYQTKPPQLTEADHQQLAEIKARSEKGDAQAQFELGGAFYSGKFGLATNYVEAVKWFRKAAERNFAKAQLTLGFCYANGLGVAKDAVEAVNWYRKAAGQNLAEAQYDLGVCYCKGQGVTKDAVEGVKWLRKAAAQNFALAQNNLGLCYGNGQGVPKDAVEGVKWLRKAAEQNLALAQHNLGFCYSQGQGVARDAAEAVKWWRQAAGQNFAEAQFNLGACYANGQGVVKDVVEAYKWMLLAAGQGSKPAKEYIPEVGRQLTPAQLAEGQKRAGNFKRPEVPSLDAQQVATDGSPLAELRAKAATGDAQAQNELGEAFYAGTRGVAKDAVAAVKWFRKAAEQNLAAAQSNLGVCYERGDGVAKYEVEAYKWYALAGAQGDTKAKRNASMLELMLSQEQIAEAKRRAQDWLEQRKKASAGKRSPAAGSVLELRPLAFPPGLFCCLLR